MDQTAYYCSLVPVLFYKHNIIVDIALFCLAPSPFLGEGEDFCMDINFPKILSVSAIVSLLQTQFRDG